MNNTYTKTQHQWVRLYTHIKLNVQRDIFKKRMMFLSLRFFKNQLVRVEVVYQFDIVF